MSNDAPVSKVNPLVKIFIVGLPLGLFLFGALSFVFYFHKRDAQTTPPAGSRYAAALRKDLNLDDYRRYVRIFDKNIGPRTLDKPDNIEAAERFIESTMGFDNMGYQIVRREFERDGRKFTNIEVELPGRSSAKKIVFVTARFDGKNSSDIAALLCLAHALTGTSHRDSIRFVATFGDAGMPGALTSESVTVNLKDSISDEAGALDVLHTIEARITQLADQATLK